MKEIGDANLKSTHPKLVIGDHPWHMLQKVYSFGRKTKNLKVLTPIFCFEAVKNPFSQ